MKNNILLAFLFLSTFSLTLSSCEKDYVAPAAQTSSSFRESFDSVANLYTRGWVITNNSRPLGTNSWFQGNATVFLANSSRAAGNEYIAANFASTTAVTTGNTANISSWLISPEVEIKNGDKISFYTRTVTNNTRPERLQVRINPVNSSSNVGNEWSSVGNFTNLLLDINSAYSTTAFPQTWTRQEVTVSGLSAPVKSRIAIRYFVENGGTSGARSNFIGLDDLEFTSN